jgi:hypothetical protein
MVARDEDMAQGRLLLSRGRPLKPQDIPAALDQTNLRTPFGPVQFKAYGKYERQNSRPTLVLQNIENNYECIWKEQIYENRKNIWNVGRRAAFTGKPWCGRYP